MSSRAHRRGPLGRFEELEPRRLLAPAGALDPSFGDGTVNLSPQVGETLTAADVAVQADGKTVIVGRSVTRFGGSRFLTARFNADGTLDATFARSGVARHGFGGLGSTAKAVAIQPDGKIVVVGEETVGSGANETLLAVARYNTDGSFDTTFSGDGKLFKILHADDTPPEVRDVAITPRGDIIVVGKIGHKVARPFLPDSTSDDFFVAVIGPTGEVRTVELLGFGEDDGARAVKSDAEGRLAVVGDVISGGTASPTRVGLARFGVDSSGDYIRDDKFEQVFALPGRTHTFVQDLLFLPFGGIIIAGHTLSSPGNHDVFVARFTAAGALDRNFADGVGFRITDLGGDDQVGGITATPAEGGGFIVSGRSGRDAMVAVKYTEDGALDTTFGTGGVARVPGADSVAPRIAPGPGQRVVLAGVPGVTAARLLLEGANVVSARVLDSSAQEGTPNTASLEVRRSELLPFPTRVFLNVSGTATFAVDRTSPRDYTMPGLVIPAAGASYVDIPAYHKFVTLTLAAVDDARDEGTETAIFSIAPRGSYEIGTPGSGTIRIADAMPFVAEPPQLIVSVVGTTTVTRPPRRAAAGGELQTAVTWTVPSGGWRGLSSVQLRLRDPRRRGAAVLLTFDEATNSFSLDTAGARRAPVRLVPGASTFRAAGASSPTVTVTFAYRFTAAAARSRFVVEVAAGNDAGEFSGFARLGRVLVSRAIPRKQAVPLPGR